MSNKAQEVGKVHNAVNREDLTMEDNDEATCDVTNNHKKGERAEHPLWKIYGFREAYQFIWSKRMGTPDAKAERPDRELEP